MNGVVNPAQQAMQQGELGRGYRSGAGLAMAVLVLLGCNQLFSLLGIPLVMSVADDPVSMASVVLVITAVLQFLCWMAVVICFLVWLAQVFGNLSALGSERITMTPGWAVGGWFIPFYNLYHGFACMQQLWIESQPASTVTETGYAIPKSAPLVGWWWAVYLISGVVGGVASFGRDTRHIDATWPAVQAFATLASAILFALVIWNVQKRQTAQHQDLVLRNAVPAPTPDRFA